MPRIAIDRPGARLAAAALAVPLYVAGAAMWVMLLFGMLRTGFPPGIWSARTLLIAVSLCLVAFPAGIVLFCAVASRFIAWRMAVSLLVPPLVVVLGLVLQPGNPSRASVIASVAIALGLLAFLLLVWAREARNPPLARNSG